MAAESGGTGILGVIVGALLVGIVGFAVLHYAGVLDTSPPKSISVDINVPKPKAE